MEVGEVGMDLEERRYGGVDPRAGGDDCWEGGGGVKDDGIVF